MSAVRTVFIAILDSVKSVIIRSQCHRRNETDIHTDRQRNVCMYCDEFDWHIYVSRRGGRDIMWTLNNVITNCHSAIARPACQSDAVILIDFTNSQTRKARPYWKENSDFWKAKCLSMLRCQMSWCHAHCHMSHACHTLSTYKTNSVECAVLSFEHHQSERGSRCEIWPGGWQCCHNQGAKTHDTWRGRVPGVIFVTCGRERERRREEL